MGLNMQLIKTLIKKYNLKSIQSKENNKWIFTKTCQ